MTTAERPVLDLATLEAHDPHPHREARQQRFLCPLPACSDKTPTLGHRSLVLDTETGAWHCHRCEASGLLRDHWRVPERTWRPLRGNPRRAFALPARQAPAPPPTLPLLPLDEAAARYLAMRGIPRDLAERNAVAGYTGRHGRRWVVFPVRDRGGQTVAYQARAADERPHPHHAIGPKAAGVFVARPVGRPVTRTHVVVEAPLDALAVAAAGCIGLACCGTGFPVWLPSLLAGRHVALGHDDDPPNRYGRRAGDEAAARLATLLRSLGGAPVRRRPTGAKDWNALLVALGPTEVARHLAE